MKLRALPFALALLAAPAMLAAQQDGLGPPPPIMAADDDASFGIEYRRYCENADDAVPFSTPPFSRAIFRTPADGPAILILCDDRYRYGIVTEINDLSVALAFMAYKPLEPFWPAAERRWGADLGKLRTELKLAVLVRGLENYPYRRMMSPDTAQMIDRAKGLSALGYYPEALALLDAQREVVRIRATGTDRFDFEIAMIASSTAIINGEQFGPEVAIDLFAAEAESHTLRDNLRINLDINRAAYLAETGRHREALDLLLPAYRVFRGAKETARAYNISGSDREFSWIIACAYAGLGNERLAEQFIAIVETAEEYPPDPYLDYTKRSTNIRLRMALCMDDPESYFAVWRSIKEPFLSDNWLDFQQGAKYQNSGPWREWNASHRDAARIARNYRQLPESYTPALNAWRDPPADRD